jgi:hypothetical protein
MDEDFIPDERLAALLAAACAPGLPHELAGEQALLAEFRRVHARKPFWRRSLRVTLPSTLLAAAVGGIALAAGVVQSPSQPEPAPTSSAAAQTAPAAASPYPPASPSPTGAPASKPPATSGLCQAYLAKSQAERGRALQSNGFRELVDAAGGPDKVDAYCAAQERAKPTKSHGR